MPGLSQRAVAGLLPDERRWRLDLGADSMRADGDVVALFAGEFGDEPEAHHEAEYLAAEAHAGERFEGGGGDEGGEEAHGQRGVSGQPGDAGRCGEAQADALCEPLRASGDDLLRDRQPWGDDSGHKLSEWGELGAAQNTSKEAVRERDEKYRGLGDHPEKRLRDHSAGNEPSGNFVHGAGETDEILHVRHDTG